MSWQVSALRSTCNRQEENAILSEENLVSQQQQHESEALAWEVREAELEDALQQLQMTQENMLRSANEVISVPLPSHQNNHITEKTDHA